jgi:dTDP-4-amino-4,6-dideoxygalactose transaminase
MSEGMFVGGEFFYDQRWETDTPALSTKEMYFLNGGGACLTVIAAALQDRGIHRILLPAYLCPSIVTILDRAGMVCDFYQIREDFSIDLDDLASAIQGSQAVYVINYFGFSHAQNTLDFIGSQRRRGILVVEDNAQAGFAPPTCGDFTFNSMRKLCPYDGGYLTTAQDMQPYIQKAPNGTNRRLPLIRQYRERLGTYLLDGKGRHSDLNRLLQTAERYYENDGVIHGDPQERDHIEHLDWEAIRKVRRENYDTIISLIASIPEIIPIYPVLQADHLPLGLPVYLHGVARDQVSRHLARAQIGLTAHWSEIASHPRTRNDPRAVSMASQILTLAVDQRFNRRHMEYQAVKLAGAVAAAKE